MGDRGSAQKDDVIVISDDDSVQEPSTDVVSHSMEHSLSKRCSDVVNIRENLFLTGTDGQRRERFFQCAAAAAGGSRWRQRAGWRCAVVGERERRRRRGQRFDAESSCFWTRRLRVAVKTLKTDD